MKRDCTDLFLRYREVARLVWNLGIWPDPTLRDWDASELYKEAMARLFEAIVLLALGYEARVVDKYCPGDAAEFRVELTSPEAELLVNKSPPGEPGRIWGRPVVRIKPGDHQLRFRSFFDWYDLAPLDFRLLEVAIERVDNDPTLVGHQGLIELDKCSIWLITDENREHPACVRDSG